MKLSNCCQAPIIKGDFCSACKEHCVLDYCDCDKPYLGIAKDNNSNCYLFCENCNREIADKDYLIDTFIRDITKVTPMPKSEARRRLDEILNNNENKDWQEEFDKKFHCDYETDEFNIYASPSKVKQFISDLLRLKNNNK